MQIMRIYTKHNLPWFVQSASHSHPLSLSHSLFIPLSKIYRIRLLTISRNKESTNTQKIWHNDLLRNRSVYIYKSSQLNLQSLICGAKRNLCVCAPSDPCARYYTCLIIISHSSKLRNLNRCSCFTSCFSNIFQLEKKASE